MTSDGEDDAHKPLSRRHRQDSDGSSVLEKDATAVGTDEWIEQALAGSGIGIVSTISMENHRSDVAVQPNQARGGESTDAQTRVLIAQETSCAEGKDASSPTCNDAGGPKIQDPAAAFIHGEQRRQQQQPRLQKKQTSLNNGEMKQGENKTEQTTKNASRQSNAKVFPCSAGIAQPSDEEAGASVEETNSLCSSQENLAPTRRGLEHDTYSLLLTTNPLSQPFVFAILVFIIQVAILALTMADLIDKGASENPFQVPIYVPMAVTVAQFLSIIVAVLVQEDVRISINSLLMMEYDPAILIQYPHATKWKWFFSIACRCLQGMLVMVVTFLFIIQSDTVLGLFTDFAALSFVSLIDNLAFSLAARGYLHRRLELATEEVRTIRFPKHVDDKRAYRIHLACLIILYVPFLAGWSIVRVKQKHSHYLEAEACKLFKVSFGPEYFTVYKGYVPKGLGGTIREYAADRFHLPDPSRVDLFPTFFYSYFSGTYSALFNDDGTISTKAHRPVYVENLRFFNGTLLEAENPPDPTRGKFFYCEKSRRWVFAVDKVYATSSDCVNEWMMRSPETGAYVLEDAPPMGWSLWTGQEAVTEEFTFLCDHCAEYDEGPDCNWDTGAVCNKRTGLCQCGESGWLGNRCVIEAACDQLVFAFYGQNALSYRETPGYEALRDPTTGRQLLAYDRPVYTLTTDKIAGDHARLRHGLSDEDIEVLIFTGLRWYDGIYNRKAFEENVLNSPAPFHAFWDDMLSSLHPMYISDPIDRALPTSGSPTKGLAWTLVPPSQPVRNFGPFGNSRPGAPESAVMWNCRGPCVHNLCGRHGTCTADDQNSSSSRTCQCKDCWGGYFCEIGPDTSYVRDVSAYYTNGSQGMHMADYNSLFWNDSVACLFMALTSGRGDSP